MYIREHYATNIVIGYCGHISARTFLNDWDCFGLGVARRFRSVLFTMCIYVLFLGQ